MRNKVESSGRMNRTGFIAPGKTRCILVLAVLVCMTAAFFEIQGLVQSGVAQRIAYGEVLSVRKVTIEDRPTGVGAAVGSTAGSVAGWAL